MNNGWTAAVEPFHSCHAYKHIGLDLGAMFEFATSFSLQVSCLCHCIVQFWGDFEEFMINCSPISARPIGKRASRCCQTVFMQPPWQ